MPYRMVSLSVIWYLVKIKFPISEYFYFDFESGYDLIIGYKFIYQKEIAYSLQSFGHKKLST